MSGFMSAYGSMLVPAAIALVLLIVLVKAISTAIRIVTAVVLVVVLVGGYMVYGRVAKIQGAAEAAVHQVSPGVSSWTSLNRAVNTSARQAVAGVGLNPAYLRVHLVCNGQAAQPSVQLRYADDKFMFGVLSHQSFDVALTDGVHC